MVRASQVFIRDLREKINLVKGALSLKHDRDFAKAIGVDPRRVDDDLGDRGRGPNWVPADRHEAMATLLAARRPGRFTLGQARLAWMTDRLSFETALAPYPDTAFGRLIEETTSTLSVSIFEMPEPGFGLTDAYPPPDPGVEMFPADRPFQLLVEAKPGRLLIVLLENQDGWRLAAPRAPEPLYCADDGTLLVPPLGLRFPVEGGYQSFFAFALDPVGAPGLLASANWKGTIPPDQLTGFAVDLCDPSRTRHFEMGRLTVYAKAAGA